MGIAVPFAPVTVTRTAWPFELVLRSFTLTDAPAGGPDSVPDGNGPVPLPGRSTFPSG